MSRGVISGRVQDKPMGAFLPLALWTSSGLLGVASGAPRARVQVNGTTVGPGFERKEGKREQRVNVFSVSIQH